MAHNVSIICPSSAGFNPAYGALPDAVFLCDYSLQTTIGPNSRNLSGCKLCCSASLATICRSVSNFVCMICFGSIPSKISKHIILTVSIVMASFHSSWFSPDKRTQNGCMNSDHLWFVVLPQQHKWARIGFKYRSLFDFSALYRTYTAKVRNLINSFKIGDWQPVFHTRDGGI